jgi:hypothetical protein
MVFLYGYVKYQLNSPGVVIDNVTNDNYIVNDLIGNEL